MQQRERNLRSMQKRKGYRLDFDNNFPVIRIHISHIQLFSQYKVPLDDMKKDGIGMHLIPKYLGGTGHDPLVGTIKKR